MLSLGAEMRIYTLFLYIAYVNETFTCYAYMILNHSESTSTSRTQWKCKNAISNWGKWCDGKSPECTYQNCCIVI